MRSIIRLACYILLIGGILIALNTYPETRSRLQLQIALFLVMAGSMVVLIRRGRRVNLGIVPEVLYCLTCAYVALASCLRLYAFH